MYGTVARLRVKPGMEEAMQADMSSFESLNVPGFIGTWVYKMDNEPNVYYLVVGFQDKDSYVNNANDPAQDARYRTMLGYMDGEPEWHDGEVVYASPMSS